MRNLCIVHWSFLALGKISERLSLFIQRQSYGIPSDYYINIDAINCLYSLLATNAAVPPFNLLAMQTFMAINKLFKSALPLYNFFNSGYMQSQTAHFLPGYCRYKNTSNLVSLQKPEGSCTYLPEHVPSSA